MYKANDKNIEDWITLDSTNKLFQKLKLNILKDNYNNIWVYSDIAIDLAHWISPEIFLKVNEWIRNIYLNNKMYKIELLLKEKEDKIKSLENICVKKQKRIEYPENNVIYILTTSENKKNRIYIVGKAINLKTRLSTYNKTCEHEVIYYKGCKTEENMCIIENIILKKLNIYREHANRDRFILPENKDIAFFIDIVKDTIDLVLS